MTQPAFVDYRWTSRAHAAAWTPIAAKLSLGARASGEVVLTDPAIAGRSRVCGGAIEGALRIHGRAADVELFATYERRLDAFPSDRFRVRWFALGFRVVSASR